MITPGGIAATPDRWQKPYTSRSMSNSAIETCIEQLAAALEPPPRQTVSEWADANRRLSSEASAERGEWRTDRAPYQRAIMDALSPHSPYERVVVMSSSQVGKTEILNNFVGYIIDRDAGPNQVRASPGSRRSTSDSGLLR